MAEMILQANVLPDVLMRFFPTEKVKVCEVDGELRLTPFTDATEHCPLYGMFSDSSLTVDKFLQWKREDKVLEQ